MAVSPASRAISAVAEFVVYRAISSFIQIRVSNEAFIVQLFALLDPKINMYLSPKQ